MDTMTDISRKHCYAKDMNLSYIAEYIEDMKIGEEVVIWREN